MAIIHGIPDYLTNKILSQTKIVKSVEYILTQFFLTVITKF